MDRYSSADYHFRSVLECGSFVSSVGAIHAPVEGTTWRSPLPLSSKSSKLDKCLQLNDESQYILLGKKAFSDVLEDSTSEFCPWGKR